MSTSNNYPRCVEIQVHLDAIAENYQTMREMAGSKAFAVVKADAYGHGADAVASYLSGIADGFAVVTVGEGIAIRDTGVSQPILVMQGPQDSADVDSIFQHGLWPVLHDETQIEMVLAHRNAIDIEPWLKVDTGMGRLGVSLASAERLLASDQLRWHGVMSHLASADDLDNPQTDTQSARLLNLVGNRDIESSLANSAGVIGWQGTERNWARIGIAMYGYSPMKPSNDPAMGLKIGMTVQAPVLSVKTLPAGHSVGYGQSYICPEDMQVAYVAIGYADGLPRVLDATADVQVRGIRCPIIGQVSMDSIGIDCRPLLSAGIEPPELSELVTVWGQVQMPPPMRPQLPTQMQPVDRLARSAGTISYDLLTKVVGRRRYTD